ncbi:MAG: cupin domain-containing protein [Solirubrobacterales bacterium]
MSFTVKNLREAEDLALKHGFSETQEARFPRGDLDAEATGLAYLVLRPGKRQPFAHRHNEAEEIYVVLSGGGRVRLDDEVLEVGAMDAVRIAPQVTRAFEAGEDGLELLVFGPRHDGDAEMVPDFWSD